MDAAKHLMRHRSVPHDRELFFPNVNGATVEIQANLPNLPVGKLRPPEKKGAAQGHTTECPDPHPTSTCVYKLARVQPLCLPGAPRGRLTPVTWDGGLTRLPGKALEEWVKSPGLTRPVLVAPGVCPLPV